MILKLLHLVLLFGMMKQRGFPLKLQVLEISPRSPPAKQAQVTALPGDCQPPSSHLSDGLVQPSQNFS